MTLTKSSHVLIRLQAQLPKSAINPKSTGRPLVYIVQLNLERSLKK